MGRRNPESGRCFENTKCALSLRGRAFGAKRKGGERWMLGLEQGDM